MHKTVRRLPILLLAALPMASADATLARNLVESCAFGAGVLATTTYAGLTPALSSGLFTVPAGEVIAANALIGCGVGMAGATAATFTGWVYDLLF